MGAWGTGIFQDDCTSDLRDFYKELVSLKFADAAILAELEQRFGRAGGLEESNFWLALALLQHGYGRLDEPVQAKALSFIDSGRALQDWVDLDGDKPAARQKELLKARATIVSPQPKRKTPRPSPEVRERIDRTYTPFPWKEKGLCAYQMRNGEYIVLATTRVIPRVVGRHYASVAGGYKPVTLPNLPQPFHVVLDYRKSRLPTPSELSKLQPVVKPIKKSERKEWLASMDEIHAMHAVSAAETFEEFAQGKRECHANKTGAEFRAHYDWWIHWSAQQRDLHADREQALQRHFYPTLTIDARQPVPSERLVDLKTERHFDCEQAYTNTDWKTLDDHLIAGQSLGNRIDHICF